MIKMLKALIFVVPLFLLSCDYDICCPNEEVLIKEKVDLIFVKGYDVGLLKGGYENYIVKNSRLIGPEDVEITNQKIDVEIKPKVKFEISDDDFTGKGYRITISANVTAKDSVGDKDILVSLPYIKAIESSLDKTAVFPKKKFDMTNSTLKIETVSVKKNSLSKYLAISWEWVKVLLLIAVVIFAIWFVNYLLGFIGLSFSPDLDD